MLKATENSMDTAHVTSASDDGRSKVSHTFQYNLNTAKTRKQLYEGAMKDILSERIRKSAQIFLLVMVLFRKLSLKH